MPKRGKSKKTPKKVVTKYTKDKNFVRKWISDYGEPSVHRVYLSENWLVWYNPPKTLIDDMEVEQHSVPEFPVSGAECSVFKTHFPSFSWENFPFSIAVSFFKFRISFHNIKNCDRWYDCLLPIYGRRMFEVVSPTHLTKSYHKEKESKFSYVVSFDKDDSGRICLKSSPSATTTPHSLFDSRVHLYQILFKNKKFTSNVCDPVSSKIIGYAIPSSAFLQECSRICDNASLIKNDKQVLEVEEVD